jgi:hypothetical protein
MATAPDSMAPPSKEPSAAEPDWLGDALRAARAELTLFGKTWLAFARWPRRTTCAWTNGAFRALNPLAYFVNILAIMTPYRLLWARFLGFQSDLPPWLDLLKPSLPFVATFSQALFAHGLLRLLGSKRRATSTVGALLYASGGWAMIFALVQWPLSLWSMMHPTDLQAAALSGGIGLVSGVVMFAILTVTLAALHGIRRRRALFALISASVVSAALWMVPAWILLGPKRIIALSF